MLGNIVVGDCVCGLCVCLCVCIYVSVCGSVSVQDIFEGLDYDRINADTN